MREIKLILSDKLFSELKTDHAIKGVSGNLYGNTDEFMDKLLKSLEREDIELKLDFKKKGRKR
jgi:hypothetical protein